MIPWCSQSDAARYFSLTHCVESNLHRITSMITYEMKSISSMIASDEKHKSNEMDGLHTDVTPMITLRIALDAVRYFSLTHCVRDRCETHNLNDSVHHAMRHGLITLMIPRGMKSITSIDTSWRSALSFHLEWWTVVQWKAYLVWYQHLTLTWLQSAVTGILWHSTLDVHRMRFLADWRHYRSPYIPRG